MVVSHSNNRKIRDTFRDAFQDAFTDGISAGPVRPPLNSTFWTDLFELFSRPWFERVWTLQELLMAKGRTNFLLGQNFCLAGTLAHLLADHLLSKTRYALH